MEKGHPKGLYLLFTVEMWERFSYYGMRAILVLFMTKYLMFNTSKSGTIYGWYTGLVYLTPLIGGYIADRYLGQRKCVMIGAIIMALGQFFMSYSALTSLAWAVSVAFFMGLALLIVGNGFFKPNIATIVGAFYERNDPRRDGAFTIFYMGVNLGAMISPLVCGFLGEKVNWGYGFLSAGIGMIIGLLIFLWGQKKYLGEHGIKPSHQVSQASGAHGPLTREEKERIAVIFIMSFFVIFFWASFEQAGSSLTLFADRSTNRLISVFGWTWEFPASYYQSVNPLLICLLAPFFSKLWVSLAGKGKNPSTPIKFVCGLLLLCAGFIVMMAASAIHDKNQIQVSMLWLMGVYLLHTLGELCISPVGLSMVTKLSPVRFTSLLLGTWFLANFAANLVGGLFAGNYDAMNHTTFFLIPTATSGAAAVLLLFLVKPLKRWMHGVH